MSFEEGARLSTHEEPRAARRFTALIVTIALVVGLASISYAGTRFFTHVACSYTGFSGTSPGQVYTIEQDADCFAGGNNVGVNARWKLNGSNWIYLQQPLYSENLMLVQIPNSPCCLTVVQGSHRARNKNPDSWSTWSSWG